jgi:hypothetical protein
VVSFPLAFLFFSPFCSTCPHLILRDLILIIFGEACKSWSSQPSLYFIPRRSKYSPNHPVLEHPQSLFLPESNFDLLLSFSNIWNDLFPIFMSRFWLAFWWWDTNIYLVFSTFTSRPTSLLASIKTFAIIYIIDVISQWSLSRYSSLAD